LNENEIASVSWDTTIRIWNLNTGNCKLLLKGDKTKILSIIKINRNQIASCSYDHVRIWDNTNGYCLLTFYGNANPDIGSINGGILKISKNKIASVRDDGSIKILSLNYRKCILTLKRHIDGFIKGLIKINQF